MPAGTMDCHYPFRRAFTTGATAVMLAIVGVGTLSHPSTAQLPPDLKQDEARAVVRIVNAERKRIECSGLRMDARLRTAAQKHAKDMSTRKYFGHNTPEGATPTDRAAAEGYTGGVGENIAKGQKNPSEVTKSWMRSTEHRHNIRDCRYRHTGVGVARASNGTRHWVQMFGFPQ
jgi:uncharacterized protein YkwD